jgi:hypothetical protein
MTTTTTSQAVVLSELEERTRQFLKVRAIEAKLTDPKASTITYTELRDKMDPSAQTWTGHRCTGIAESLDRINRYEHDHGRPMISALVVLAGEGHPGPGFAKCARSLDQIVPADLEQTFWRIELAKVIRYWQSL